jgi:hypothetical protein
MRLVTVMGCMACLACLPVHIAVAQCTPVADPDTILGDWPTSDVDWTLYVEPIEPGDFQRFVGPPLVDTPGGDLLVRAWNYMPSVPGYGSPGIVESHNVLRSDQTALILVHPWGIEDGQGWGYPQAYNAYGYAFTGHLSDNLLVLDHMDDLVKPLVDSVRGRLPLVAYSLPGGPDSIRGKLYRDYDSQPGATLRAQGRMEIEAYLNGLTGSQWPSSIPAHKYLDYAPDDVVVYDDLGYTALRNFLWDHGIQNVLLGGFCTDMCVISTTAGYQSLTQSFDVFMLGTATLACWPTTPDPFNGYDPHPTRDELIVASQHSGLHPIAVTQASWLQFTDPDPGAAHAPGWRGDVETILAWWDNWQARDADDPHRQLRRTPDHWKIRSYRDPPEDPPFVEFFDTGLTELTGAHEGRVNVAKVSPGRELVFNMPAPAVVGPYVELRLQVSWKPATGQSLITEYLFHEGFPATALVLEERVEQENGWVVDVLSATLESGTDTALISLAFSTGTAFVEAIVIDAALAEPPGGNSPRPGPISRPPGGLRHFSGTP